MGSDIVGASDPNEVKRARAKYLAIVRAQWRLRQRLETIDHEYDVVLPGLQRLEQRITVVGELPEVNITVDEDPNDPLPPPPPGA